MPTMTQVRRDHQRWAYPSATRRTRRWSAAPLILIAVLIMAFVIGPAQLWRLGRTHLGGLDIARWSQELNPFGGSAAGAAAGGTAAQAVAAVVDIDTALRRQHAVGAGTGIVIESSGLVLTNNHVVEGATAIRATDIGNGRTYAASVLGRDRRHDIALLQLRGAKALATAPLGDSSRVAVGDHVFAIGNAGGKGGAPAQTPGTVMALNQTVTAADDLTGRSERLTGLIAIAAAVVAGDSGGPLVNDSCQVVGIDTAGSEGYRVGSPGGQGFAVPIDQELQIAQRLRE
jgi:S1-C subfamily serine protease